MHSPQAEEYPLLSLTRSEQITYSTLSRHHMDFTYAYMIQPGDSISQGYVHAPEVNTARRPCVYSGIQQ